MTTNKSIQTSKKSPKILTITINRPHVFNALNAETLHGLELVLQEAGQSPDVGGMIITGEGEKAFIAGADIKELANLSNENALKFAQYGHKLFKMLEESSKPTIAVINGFALGGGCELAMACHIRIAVESAKLGQPEVNLGIIPGYGGTQRLTQLVGRGKALEWMMTGDMISAAEALKWGLVNHVVATKADALETAETMMNKILAKGPVAISKLISSVNAGFTFEANGYEKEASNFADCTTTFDFKEGTSAFIDKRQAKFKGE
jgi:enoyl-CoA hydratase